MSFNRRSGRDRPSRYDRSDRGDRPGRDQRRDRPDRFEERDARPRDAWRPPGPRPPAPRRGPDRFEDAGMSIRLDPRRLSALKQLAGEAGLRPGELVLRWVEERLDAERRGVGVPAGATSAGEVAALTARIDELADRITALESVAAREPSLAPAASEPLAAGPEVAATEAEQPEGLDQPEQPAKRRRGRPPKAASTPAVAGPRVALHDEIIAVIEERGPSSAAEIAEAIAERGRYTPPRSGKGLNAATVNSRVSNPAYRDRFRRQDGRIALADRD